MQDQVTTRVGNSIEREMVIAAVRNSHLRTSDPNATDLLLQAKALELQPWSSTTYKGTQALYRKVLALEPNNVRWSVCHIAERFSSWKRAILVLPLLAGDAGHGLTWVAVDE